MHEEREDNAAPSHPAAPTPLNDIMVTADTAVNRPANWAGADSGVAFQGNDPARSRLTKAVNSPLLSEREAAAPPG
jgi:hypothetical protein